MPASNWITATSTAALALLGTWHPVSASDEAPRLLDQEISELWDRFRAMYGRSDLQSSEGDRRFDVFKQNVEKAHRLNLEQGITCTDMLSDEACVFGVTKFSDLSPEELAATRLGYKRASPILTLHEGEEEKFEAPVLSPEALPEAPIAKDWRTEGAVGRVRDQGGCGSCWAHSTVEEVESQFFMATGKLPELSVQQLISCDDDEEDCFGGDVPTTYGWIKEKGGLDTEANFPSTQDQGDCKPWHAAVRVTGWKWATKSCRKGECRNQDEDALARALAAKGPVSVCMFVSDDWWQYKGGIFSLPNCSSSGDYINHCLQLVGYNKSTTSPYWILRNSWNTTWGLDGYMHLAMGNNTCGIANEATIVEVARGEEGVMVV